MSRKSGASKRRRSRGARPNSKAFLMQRIMGIVLLLFIVAVLAIIAVTFFKEGRQVGNPPVRGAAQGDAAGTGATSAQTPAQGKGAAKYTFYDELRKRNEEVQVELQEKIAQAEKADITGRHYRIQIGAFSDRDHADRLRAKMILRDYPVQIINDGSLFLVQIGPYSEREKAVDVQNRLQREGIKDHVLKAYVN